MTIPDYVTLNDVKAYMPTNEVATTTIWDGEVTKLCTNCSRAFDKLTFRQPGAYAVGDDTTRYFDGVPVTATDFQNSLFVDEFVAVTSVAASQNGGSFVPLAPTDYWLWPYNAAVEGRPYLRIDLDVQSGQTKRWPFNPHSVQVIGKFGYSAEVPADVQEAILLYVVYFVRKSQQNYLEVGTVLDSGQVMIGMKVDQALKTLIETYRKGRL